MRDQWTVNRGRNGSAPAPTAASDAPTVLVVADDPALADSLAALLENSGYTPSVTSDGPAALGYLQAGIVDLVIINGDLPGISGFELCRQMADCRAGL